VTELYEKSLIYLITRFSVHVEKQRIEELEMPDIALCFWPARSTIFTMPVLAFMLKKMALAQRIEELEMPDIAQCFWPDRQTIFLMPVLTFILKKMGLAQRIEELEMPVILND